MKHPEFTSGPWIIEPHGKALALYSGRDEQHHGLRLLNLEDGDSNFTNNLNLIEASPDLYEALNEIVQTLKSLGHYLDTEKAETALAKARGEKE